MAEAFLNNLAGDKFEAESAGLEPGKINPLVIDVMKEMGIDLSGNRSKSVFDLFKQGHIYQFVITVCDEASAERCPVFPGVTKGLNWSFEDPSKFTGTYNERLSKTRLIRDQIKSKIANFTKTYQTTY